MWQVVKEHPRAFMYAVLVHLALVVMLVFSLDWTPKPTASGAAKPEPVQAVVVDAAKVDAEVQRLQEDERRKEQEAAERVRQLEEQARQAETARKQEQQRLEELKQQQAAEQKRLQEQEAKRRIEQQKQAEAKRKAEAEAKAKAQADAKRKAEAEAKAKAEAEAKRKAEAAAKAKAEADAKAKAEAERKAAEKALQDQLAAERAALDAARNQQILAQYTNAIQQKVIRSWRKPPSWQGMSCTVRVQLMPGGGVASVQIVQSSGDAAYDRSVEDAVYRAAPLPLPPDPALFESLRVIQFVFAPR
ncbi:MAG: cell envelope integrity protein TolA [Gammaproteobacteria bacterium]